jgi:hypothetical protein
MPSTPNVFLGGGMLWAYGEFSQAELEEMEQDPEGFQEMIEDDMEAEREAEREAETRRNAERKDNSEGEAEDGLSMLREMSEPMEERDAKGGHPTGRAELAVEQEDAGPPPTQSRRGQSWSAREDRMLVLEVLDVDPYTCVRGAAEARWAEISGSMSFELNVETMN